MGRNAKLKEKQKWSHEKLHLENARKLRGGWRRNKRHPVLTTCGQRFGKSEAAQRKEKQMWAIEKPKLDYARRLHGIYFIDPADAEFKEAITNARRTMEVPIPAAMPCKIRRGKYKETCRTPKTNYACIVEADELTRKRVEGISTQRSWRPYCMERNELIEPLQSRAQVYSYVWSNEDIRSKSSSGQGTRKIGENFGVEPDESQKHKSEVIDEARHEGKTVHFASLMDICHLKIRKNDQNCGNGDRTKLACILEASESTRLRMGESLPNHHEDHIAGKGDNSLQHYNLVHKFIPMPQAMKIPAAKAAVDKEWEKLEKIPAWKMTKVRSRKRGDRWSKDEGRKSSFRLTDGHMSFENCWVGGKAPKIQRSSCTPRWYCKRRLRVLRSIHRTRIISITNDSSKGHGYHIQTARMRRTSSWRSICWYAGKWKMLQNYWKFQNGNVQTFGCVHHDTNGRNRGRVWKTQSFLLNAICTVILLQDFYGKGNLRRSYWSMGGRKFQIGNVSLYIVKKDYSYLWMTQNWLETNKTLIRCGKHSTKKLSWENQHLSLIMYFCCVLKANVKWAETLLTNTEPCLNPEFPPEQLKNYHAWRR